MALCLVKRYKGCYGDNATVEPGNSSLTWRSNHLRTLAVSKPGSPGARCAASRGGQNQRLGGQSRSLGNFIGRAIFQHWDGAASRAGASRFHMMRSAGANLSARNPPKGAGPGPASRAGLRGPGPGSGVLGRAPGSRAEAPGRAPGSGAQGRSPGRRPGTKRIFLL